MILRIFILAAVAFGVSLPSWADSWEFPIGVNSDTYEFGTTRIVRTRNSVKDRKYPEWILRIYRGKELRGLYRGVSFERLATNKDQTVFVGISNFGLPGTAVIVFNEAGEMIALRNHAQSLFKYCRWSITTAREWYDAGNPELRFEYDDSGLPTTITVNGCDGKRVDILEAIEDV